MAKGTSPKVTPSLEPSISSIPSLLNCVDILEDKNDSNISRIMRSFEGEHKISFYAFMTQLGKANCLIEEH